MVVARPGLGFGRIWGYPGILAVTVNSTFRGSRFAQNLELPNWWLVGNEGIQFNSYIIPV